MGGEKITRDVWPTRTGFAILAHTPAQAATIAAKAKEVETAFGAAKVERQETWATFIVGPVPKHIRSADGMVDPVAEGLLHDELQSVSENMPIRHLCLPVRVDKFKDLRREACALPVLLQEPNVHKCRGNPHRRCLAA